MTDDKSNIEKLADEWQGFADNDANIDQAAIWQQAVNELRVAIEADLASGWVRAWSCPECAFTFDAAHEDTDGGYSCPMCAETELRAEIERLRDEVREESEARRLDIIRQCDARDAAEAKLAAISALAEDATFVDQWDAHAVTEADLRAVLDREAGDA